MHSKPIAFGSLLLIGLAWTVPFLQPYHRYPIPTFYSEWIAFGFGLAALFPLALRSSWRDGELPAIALVPAALALLLGVQVALGRVPYPEQAIIATWYLLWAALLVVLGRVLARELGIASIAMTLAWFLLAGGLLSALVSFAQYFNFFPGSDFPVMSNTTARVYGNLGQPNHYAAYLAMAAGSLAYLHAAGRLRLPWVVACAALLLPALALSASRGTWIYFGLMAILAGLIAYARHDTASRRLLAVSLALAAAYIVAVLLVAPNEAAPAQSAVAGAGAGHDSARRVFESASGFDPRLQLATEAWRMFLSSPVLGAGFGQFAWNHFLFVAETGASAAPDVYNHAHNLVLQLMAETGTAGALLVVGAAMLWLVDLRGIRLDPDWWWLLALLGILGAHSMMEYPLWYSYFLGMAALLLGLGARRTVQLRLSGLARATVAAMLAVGWFNLVSLLPSYREFENLIFSPNAAELADERALVDGVLRAQTDPLLAPYAELVVAYGVKADEEQLREKLELVDRVIRFAPVWPVIYRQAQLLALAGEREAALRRIEQAARVYPGALGEMHSELAILAHRHPAEMAPLLELAAEILSERRAARGIR
jgi:O-antigen ligase